jgi:hypothetical protein
VLHATKKEHTSFYQIGFEEIEKLIQSPRPSLELFKDDCTKDYEKSPIYKFFEFFYNQNYE